MLQILESNFSLRDSDVRLLLLYRTQAVLKDREVSRSLVSSAAQSGSDCDTFFSFFLLFFFILEKQL